MSAEILRETNLPALENFPDRVVTTITRDRWGDQNTPGAVFNMIRSAQQVMAQDGINQSSLMLIADGSDKPHTAANREGVLFKLDDLEETAPIFFLTPELQTKLVDILVEKTHLRPEIVRKIVFDPEYDSNRTKLEATLAAVALGKGGVIRALGLDDDIVAPLHIRTIKPDILSSAGVQPQPNSFIFWPGDPLSDDAFDHQPNSIIGFFDPLGKTVGELAASMPDLVVSGGWTDEMHEVMEDLRGKPETFHVTHHPQRIRDGKGEKDVVIQAVTSTKTRLPDPRTVRYVEQYLQNDLEPPESTIYSYKAGPAAPFVFYKAGVAGAVTNVDSANKSWRFSPETAYLLRWFPSDPNISKMHGMVSWQYRSDNEWLPMYLVKLWKSLQRRYAYLTGIDTEMEHHRASSGYRPEVQDPAEPAAASLVGHEMSEAALNRMEFAPDGSARLNLSDIKGNVIPRANARKVFNEMRTLRATCADKIIALEDNLKTTSERKTRMQMKVVIHRYRKIYDSIMVRIGIEFPEFYKRLNHEAREQLPFTDEVLAAYPIIINELATIIRSGKFSVMQYVPPRERGKNYPHSNSSSQVLFEHRDGK